VTGARSEYTTRSKPIGPCQTFTCGQVLCIGLREVNDSSVKIYPHFRINREITVGLNYPNTKDWSFLLPLHNDMNWELKTHKMNKFTQECMEAGQLIGQVFQSGPVSALQNYTKMSQKCSRLVLVHVLTQLHQFAMSSKKNLDSLQSRHVPHRMHRFVPPMCKSI
jgi:hypothetical protein